MISRSAPNEPLRWKTGRLLRKRSFKIPKQKTICTDLLLVWIAGYATFMVLGSPKIKVISSWIIRKKSINSRSNLETCQSGRTSKPGKFVYAQVYRGFESLSLRHRSRKALLIDFGRAFHFVAVWSVNTKCFLLQKVFNFEINLKFGFGRAFSIKCLLSL